MTAKATKTSPAPASGNIHQRIPAIMREIEALPKERRNEQQHYQFRGIDEVYNLIHPLMAKHGVFMSCTILSDRTEERQSRSGGNLIYRILNIRFRFTAEDGSFVETDVIGEGMDSGDKAANKAMSVGQKYAILQMFMVPTSDAKDPELDSPEVAPKKPAAQPNAKNGEPPASTAGFIDDFLDEPAPPDAFAHLKELATAKKAVGDEVYYAIIGGWEANHANEIPVDARPAVLEALRGAWKTGRKLAAK